MLIAGFNKTSFVDYPGKLCAVVFTPACNFDCWYCQNRHILRTYGLNLISEGTVLEHLQKRRGLLEGLTVTGGEPTLQKDLPQFLKAVKQLSYLIKLDTNGTRPEIIEGLIKDKLVDYIAMDIKAPLKIYENITRTSVNLAAIKKSISIIMNSGIAYEFRTTFAPTLTQNDILELCDDIKGAKAYYLQQYRSAEEKGIPEVLRPYPKEMLIETAEKVREKLGVCVTRGID